MSQLTFTKKDVDEAAKWLNFVISNASWGSNITTKQAIEISLFVQWAQRHAKMMNDHILELVEHIPVDAKEQARQDRAEKKAKVNA